jgi:cardiolipin synthase
MAETVWRFGTQTEKIWNEMIADIKTAQNTIEIEQYSFWDDESGHKVLLALEAKAKQGVKIRIICDGYGSYPLFASGYVKKLQKIMQILPYNMPQFSKPKLWMRRLHKKTMIVDSKVAWVGGIGIKNKFINFRDTQVRLEGEVVTSIQQVFENFWQSVKENYKSLDLVNQNNSEFKFLVNYPGYNQKQIYEWLRSEISRAKKRIYLTTSYFFPDQNFFQLILDKAKAGVDVKLIVRGKDDEHVPIRFSASYFLPALKNHIELYKYEHCIIHAKTAVIDDAATVGSCNLDKFSFYYNLESNIATSNPKFVEEVANQFFADLKHCSQIYINEWEKRPLKERAYEVITWPLHNYL